MAENHIIVWFYINTPAFSQSFSVPLSQSFIEIETDADDLTLCKRAAEENNGTFVCRGGILAKHALNTKDRIEKYYGGLRVGGASSLNIVSNQRSLYTELISSNLNFSYLGYARIGFGALITSGDDSVSTANQFFQGGGNAALFVSVPLAYRSVTSMEGNVAQLVRRHDLLATFTVGADLPALNTAADKFAVVTQFGPQYQLVQHSTDDTIRLFFLFDLGVGWGHNDFFANLNTETPRGGFFASSQMTLGLELNDIIRIGASRGTSTVENLSQSCGLVVQLIPK
ncbi:hypothetical protein DYD21_14260 [Rhodohalobacter sp. SW132]|uniref:hypothetical protein n=1 Tax=Rhodohalobacter sp. SW132 TaxID=2293433 RepID=UPI000E2815C0|nr:hypothetical protein [Rhodohalobacter sp. SW132]REL32975.1 hypothetical protein DYD21_14260 [Rhodohalobacter sp. SW132]